MFMLSFDENFKKVWVSANSWEYIRVNNVLFCTCIEEPSNRVFSHDVTSAILVSQTSPEGDELFSYANDFFCSKTYICIDAGHVSENSL